MQLRRHGASSVVLRSQSRYASGDQAYIIVFLKQKNSLKSASDLFWSAHDGASTSNRGRGSMIGNRSLRCGLIDQTRELRTKY